MRSHVTVHIDSMTDWFPVNVGPMGDIVYGLVKLWRTVW